MSTKETNYINIKEHWFDLYEQFIRLTFLLLPLTCVVGWLLFNHVAIFSRYMSCFTFLCILCIGYAAVVFLYLFCAASHFPRAAYSFRSETGIDAAKVVLGIPLERVYGDEVF